MPNASSADRLKPEKRDYFSYSRKWWTVFEDKLVTLENIENIVLQSPKDVPIHINTDKNTKFESFVEVLDMLKKKSIL